MGYPISWSRGNDAASIAPPWKETLVILVIDDEPAITELLTDILEYHGHPVVVANDAESALDILPLYRPSVIMVDLMMPSVDGLSLAVTLKHSPGTIGIPLIAMSASDSALALADRVGDFDAHISKPFENDELIQLVERFIPVAS
jgi:CheY-like chemotaxis protein